MTIRALLAATVLLASALPLAAQSPGRFTMHPAEGGAMLRLDTETGAVSLCRGTATAFACEAVADDRKRLEEEIARLGRENADLQSAIKRLEQLAGIPADKAPSPTQPKAHGGIAGLPGPEDVDRAMSYLNSMLRKFREKLRELESMDGKPTERL